MRDRAELLARLLCITVLIDAIANNGTVFIKQKYNNNARTEPIKCGVSSVRLAGSNTGFSEASGHLLFRF